MTKLGAQPGVHGGEDLEKEAIKIDPKVFTVLQPTIIPMPAPPMTQGSPGFWRLWRALLSCLFFFVLLAFVTMIGLYFIQATPTPQLFKLSEKPQMEALISSKPVEGSSEKTADSGIMAIPLARVVVVEDISSNDQKKTVVDGSVEEKSTTNLDNVNRPLHPDEMEQYRQMEARQYFQRMMEEQAYMQQMMAMRMWRMRRLQAAYYQQQQMKMAYFQQQQQQLQEEAARQQWAERARYEEDQQQRRQWEAQQAFAQQQRAQAFWQQHQMEMQAQAQQAQQVQQPQHFWPRPQRPSVWQQPPQQFFFPQQQQSQEQPQQEPSQFFQPAPQPSVHDKIYEELQKKSQNIPVNAPTRQIWTAITPTPAPEEQPSTVNTAAAPVSTTQMPDAAEVSDTILRDIFSAFDEQKNSEAAHKELTPSATTEQPELEGKDAIVIEDSFPRIEERTTTPESADSEEEIIETSSAASGDHEKELDPFAAVLKFFENNPPRGVVVSSEASTTEKPIIV